MGVFDYIRKWSGKQPEEVRASSPGEAALEAIWIDEYPGNQTSNRVITEENSLTLAAVWACVNVISDSASILPIHLYSRNGDKRQRVYNHQAYDILHNPNDYTISVDLIKTLLTHVLLWGNGYLLITRDKYYRPIELKNIEPYKVTPVMSPEGVLFYFISDGKIINYDDIIHVKGLSVDGYEGKSPIRVHRENLNLSHSAQDYGVKFFSQGGNMSGIYSMPKKMTPEEYDRLQASLIRRSTGLGNAHKPLVLENGLTYERISIPPEDAQFLGTRKFQKTEIATIFKVPPHKIADLDRATNNNIEHQGMEFVTDCLMPYIVRMEQEFARKLLRADEQKKYFYRFEMGALLRGDSIARSGYYKNMTYIGAMSANEVRALEDMNAYDGGNEFFIPSNMQTVSNAIKIKVD